MKKDTPFQTGNVILISAAHMVHDIYSSFLAPLLPYLIETLGISYAQAGMLSVVQRLPSLLNPLVGILADKISVRYFLIIAPALTTISMSLLGVASHFRILVVLLFIMGISSTLFHVPGPVFIRNLSGPYIGKGMSYYMLGGELARTLGPLTILGAVSLWGLHGTWKLIPFGLAASGILYLRFRTLDVRHQSKTRMKNAYWKKLLPFFIMLTIVVFFRAMLKNAFTTFLPTFMTASGSSAIIGGSALAAFQFTGALGTFLAGSISDKIGRVQTLLIIAVIAPFLMLAFIHLEGLAAFIILLILGFFVFANTPILLALVQEVGNSSPATVNGVYMTINFGISSLASLLIGFLGDQFSLHFSFKVAAFCSLGGIPATFILLKWMQRKTDSF